MALIAVGITILLLAASVLPAVGDERSSLMRQPMTPHGVAGTAVRDGRTSLDTPGSQAPTEDRPQGRRVRMNACAGKTALGYWIEKPRDEDPNTRVLAAQALGDMKDRTAVPALIRALKDTNQSVRVAAVQALGRIGPGASAAAPVLRQMLGEQDGLLRDEVSRSLEKIASKSQK